MYGINNAFGSATPEWLVFTGGALILVMVWSAVWKALALWHSARRGQVAWFVVMMIVNTLGILEIIYLFGVAKLKFNNLFSR